jgi:hypothetical protein
LAEYPKWERVDAAVRLAFPKDTGTEVAWHDFDLAAMHAWTGARELVQS